MILILLLWGCGQNHRLLGPYDAESVLEDDTPNPDIFESAADLDTFRNVDPTKFEWVNPKEIQAGEVTCGFLKSPFGWPAGSITGFKESDSQTDFPIAQVCKSVQCDMPWIISYSLCTYARYYVSWQMYVLDLLKSNLHLVVSVGLVWFKRITCTFDLYSQHLMFVR